MSIPLHILERKLKLARERYPEVERSMRLRCVWLRAALAKGLEPEGLDKDYVRRWLLEQGYTGDGAPPPLTDEVRIEAARRYIDACERITGEPFVPDTRPPAARILQNLSDVT